MKKQKGMTLVGVLIGIMILSIALAAQLKLISNTIKRETDMKNIIIASNLSREGVEIGYAWRMRYGWENLKLIKNQTACADVNDMLSKTDVGEYVGSSCTIDKLNIGGYPNYSSFNTFLYEASSNDDYNAPPFWRTIKIEGCDDLPDDECLVIASETGWDNTKSVKITKKMYNWYIP